jgi:hypothetical protein
MMGGAVGLENLGRCCDCRTDNPPVLDTVAGVDAGSVTDESENKFLESEMEVALAFVALVVAGRVSWGGTAGEIT